MLLYYMLLYYTISLQEFLLLQKHKLLQRHKVIHCSIISIIKYWKLPKCPNKGDWLNELWHTHAVECEAAVKKDGELGGKDFHNILSNENTRTQVHKNVALCMRRKEKWETIHVCAYKKKHEKDNHRQEQGTKEAKETEKGILLQVLFNIVLIFFPFSFIEI